MNLEIKKPKGIRFSGFIPSEHFVPGAPIYPSTLLGPPVKRLEEGYQLFSLVYFRGTLPRKSW